MSAELTDEELTSLRTDWPPFWSKLAKLLRAYESLTANQVTPAMMSEFEIGKEQRDKLREQVESLTAERDESYKLARDYARMLDVERKDAGADRAYDAMNVGCLRAQVEETQAAITSLTAERDGLKIARDQARGMAESERAAHEQTKAELQKAAVLMLNDQQAHEQTKVRVKELEAALYQTQQELHPIDRAQANEADALVRANAAESALATARELVADWVGMTCAGCEELEALFQQTHGCHHSWVSSHERMRQAIDAAIRDMLSGGHPFEAGVAMAINRLRAARSKS